MADATTHAPPQAGADRNAARAEQLLEGLNPPQREAVTHGTGPLLVLAGAGSGKTRVLTHRIAHLVATGAAKPSEILAITFTNKAAQEMRDRVELVVGRMVRVMWVMTFHSACARILRTEAERLGYTKRFSIYDDADSVRLVRRCLDELSVDPKRFAPRAIKSQISRAKNQLEDAAAYRERVSSFFEQTAADVYELYEKRIHEMNAVDFDDLLFRTVNLLELFPDVAERYRQRVPLDPGRRVPGHQPRPVPPAAAAGRRAAQRVRGRRRRPVDLRLPRRGHQQHPRLRARLPGRARREAGAELPLHADDPVGRQRGGLQQRGPQAQGAVERPRHRRPGAGRGARGRARRGPLRRLGDRAAGGRGHLAGRGRGLLPDERAEPRAGGHAGAGQRRLPGDRGDQVLRARRDQGRARLPDVAHQPRRLRLLRPRREHAQARHRPDDGQPGAGTREHDGRAGDGDRRGPGAGPGPGPGRGEGARPLRLHRRAVARADRALHVGDLLRERARGDRIRRGARGGADDRGAGEGGEPPGAGRCRARVRRELGGGPRPSRAGGVPPAAVALLGAGRACATRRARSR